MEIITAWLLTNLASLAQNIALTIVGVLAGFGLAVRWNRKDAKERERAEKESLMRNIAFFVNDCRLSMADAEENIKNKLPPLRPLPCSGIEHFQEQLMRFGEHSIFVQISTLRSSIEQVNFPTSVMAHQFVVANIEPGGSTKRQAILNTYYEEVTKRFVDIKQHCHKLGSALEGKLAELKIKGTK